MDKLTSASLIGYLNDMTVAQRRWISRCVEKNGTGWGEHPYQCGCAPCSRYRHDIEHVFATRQKIKELEEEERAIAQQEDERSGRDEPEPA